MLGPSRASPASPAGPGARAVGDGLLPAFRLDLRLPGLLLPDPRSPDLVLGLVLPGLARLGLVLLGLVRLALPRPGLVLVGLVPVDLPRPDLVPLVPVLVM